MVIERLRARVGRDHPKAALFDFDGTISLIRSGWMDAMVPMMVEILSECRSGESEQALTEIVREFVGRLTGKQTIYQMIELAEQVSKRGGLAKDPLEYKDLYLRLLNDRISGRLSELRGGSVDPDRYTVPGTRALLSTLSERGLTMYLASGTDDAYVQEEAALLDVTPFFAGGVYGALDDYKSFSKRILIQRLIAESTFRGTELVGFGDGYVEIENVKEVDGIAIGVATDEPDCIRVDEWKRERLIQSGADYIIPNFLGIQSLETELFPNE